VKNKPIIVLLTIIAVLLAGNLLVTATTPAWAQDRPERPDRPSPPRGPQDRLVQPERPDRPFPPGMRANRCVGIAAIGDMLYIAFEDGTVERRNPQAAPATP
jgi:hypothetical protein